MAKRPAAPRSTRSRSSEEPRAEFLRPDDVPRGRSIQLDIRPAIRLYTSEYGTRLILGVQLDGNDYDWGIKLGSANYIELEQKFGRNLMAWPTNSIKVRRETFEGRDGRDVTYLAVEGSEKHRRNSQDD